MSRTIRRAGPGAALALLALASCQTAPPPATPQAQSMQYMLGDVQVLRAYVRNQASQDAAAAAAEDLVTWSHRLGALFPPETAAEYVDMTPDIARIAPPVMIDTATEVAIAVHAGNPTVTGPRLARLEHDGCGMCHRNGWKE